MIRTKGFCSGTSTYHCVPYSPVRPGSLFGRHWTKFLYVAVVTVALMISRDQLVRKVSPQLFRDHGAELFFDPRLVGEVTQRKVQLGLQARDGVQHPFGVLADADVPLGGEVD